MMRALLLFLGFIFTAPQVWAVAKVEEVEKNVWLIEDHSLPLVTVKVAFEDSGAASDPAAKDGLASFVAQMIDEGAGDMPGLAYQHALEDHAVRVGVDVSEDMLTVSLQTQAQFKSQALDLLTLALKKPRFDKEAVERIRASIESDLKQAEENPGYLASRRWKEIAFAAHPYQHPRRGTVTSVAGITREDMQSFASMHFACSPKHIAIVGDITAAEVRLWLASLSGGVACALPSGIVKDVPVPDGQAPQWVEKDVPQTVVEASLPAVKRDDPRFYAVYVLNYIVGGDTLTSRLGVEIRDKRGLAYYAQSEVQEFDHASALLMRFATRSAEAQVALDVFLHELKTISSQGVTQSEFEDAKNYLIGSFPLEIDNENALAEYLIAMQHYKLGSDYLDKRNRMIAQVTLNEVNEAAKSLLSHTPLVVMVGHKPQAKDTP